MKKSFKKKIIKEIDKCIKTSEDLLILEGSLSDVRELPLPLVRTTKEQIDFLKACKIAIKDEAFAPRRTRPTYRTPSYGQNQEDF